MTDEPLPPGPDEPAHPRWLLPVIGAGIVALVACNYAGVAMWAKWITARPLELLALNSTNKFLIGTTPNSALVAVLVVSTLRLMAPDPLFYSLGYLYRDRALHWARTAFPTARNLLDSFEQDRPGFGRTLDVLVFVVPNNPVCLLAGAASMDRRRFVLLSLSGTIARIALMRGIGTLFEDQITSLLEQVTEYQRYLTIGSIALVLLYVLWQARSRRGLVGGLEELEQELGDPP